MPYKYDKGWYGISVSKKNNKKNRLKNHINPDTIPKIIAFFFLLFMHSSLFTAFTNNARKTILQMVANAQSGHPGGSLSCIDYLSYLYTQIIGKTGEKVIVSNGHISPAVYAVLSEMAYADKNEVITSFRQFGSHFEGHITRLVPGVEVGTGPLGAGISMGAGFALAEKLSGTEKRVFGLMGDGEMQEGQVYETMLFAAAKKLNNYIVFVDYNRVQLSGSLDDIMPIDIESIGKSCGWNVLCIDGHSFEEIDQAVKAASKESFAPTLIIGKTIMGKGAAFMESAGLALKADWHGKAPSLEQVEETLPSLTNTQEDEERLQQWKQQNIIWHPTPSILSRTGEKNSAINTGTPLVYEAGVLTDCRTSYGKALEDLAKHNPNIIALTADLRSSVMTKFVATTTPAQHIEVGIAEQNMVSVSGGLSLSGYVPFCSTFGAFMTSRAKDQARLNDINHCNVKMVATHCGLSVGEDGPTHQAIDDMGSFLGLFNTQIIEPSDPNHCDRIIRHVASSLGSYYVRMGRHKIPVLTYENGELVFGSSYQYAYGKCERLREGSDITIVAMGATVIEALRAREQHPTPEKIEIIIASSPACFDDLLRDSLQKTKKVITVEDHNPYSGLSAGVQRFCFENAISPLAFESCSVTHYQLSGKDTQLYHAAGIDADGILAMVNKIL